jgi:hypothetical protein
MAGLIFKTDEKEKALVELEKLLQKEDELDLIKFEGFEGNFTIEASKDEEDIYIDKEICLEMLKLITFNEFYFVAMGGWDYTNHHDVMYITYSLLKYKESADDTSGYLGISIREHWGGKRAFIFEVEKEIKGKEGIKERVKIVKRKKTLEEANQEILEILKEGRISFSHREREEHIFFSYPLSLK